MKRFVSVTCMILMVAGCVSRLPSDSLQGEARASGINSDIAIRPKPRPPGLLAKVGSVIRPPSNATTVEQFDTTTAQDRAEALAAPVETGGERSLGTTIASLGSPTEPGFWMKTPLVSSQAEGRVVYPATGKSVQVTLIPIEGPATAGSRLSLPALRLLEAPLTGLPEVEVFAES